MEMIFGDQNTIFKKFDDEYAEDAELLADNDGKVKLTEMGFAEEWQELVDYRNSYAYIKEGKLHVVVHGLPEHINKESVEKFFKQNLEHYTQEGDGEFFEVEEGCPIQMVVEHNGNEVKV
jgi:hypothetical protein